MKMTRWRLMKYYDKIAAIVAGTLRNGGGAKTSLISALAYRQIIWRKANEYSVYLTMKANRKYGRRNSWLTSAVKINLASISAYHRLSYRRINE